MLIEKNIHVLTTSSEHEAWGLSIWVPESSVERPWTWPSQVTHLNYVIVLGCRQVYSYFFIFLDPGILSWRSLSRFPHLHDFPTQMVDVPWIYYLRSPGNIENWGGGSWVRWLHHRCWIEWPLLLCSARQGYPSQSSIALTMDRRTKTGGRESSQRQGIR